MSHYEDKLDVEVKKPGIVTFDADFECANCDFVNFVSPVSY
jgi:hypothetical protein